MWLPALDKKKVLIISPFEKSIQIQFPKRKKLFTTSAKFPNFNYPEFDMQILKCPNTIKGNDPYPDEDWEKTFRTLCEKINNLDFDIAILGCGSYGMSLAHHIKKIGKSSLYAGSHTQLMFGIKGKRWDIPGNPNRSYWNEYWKWPEDDETPKSYKKVENGCYWK